MLTPKNLIIIVAILLLVAGAAGWFIYKDWNKARVLAPTASTPNEKKPEIALSSEEIKKKMPDLDREIAININTQLPADFKEKTVNEIKEMREKLKEDYNTLENWLQLGLLYKAIGDFEGAAEAWEFATLIRPNDAVAFHNLGDLYWLNLPDFPKAEKYLLKAIEINPHPMFYQKLHELYRYSYKEKADLADDILKEGISKDPKQAYLMAVLADYYRDIGDTTNALVYYEKALTIELNNAYLKQNIEKLKEKL